jgi:transcriptional/translational regulatory protein YebC/TACO1
MGNLRRVLSRARGSMARFDSLNFNFFPSGEGSVLCNRLRYMDQWEWRVWRCMPFGAADLNRKASEMLLRVITAARAVL